MIRVAAVVLSLTVLAGCATSTVPGSIDTARTVTVGFADKGHTVRLHPGDTVRVRLNSMYWQFGAVHGRALRRTGVVRHPVPMSKTVPGSGAGTLIVSYRADHAGIATITAGRVSCGEAMRCVGGQGSFRMYVVVR